MATATDNDLLPEEVVTAVLNRVGTGTRIIDDVRLAEIFHRAAERHGGVFKQFLWHPRYRYSPTLTDAFQSLDHGGAIQRDNPASTYFTITPHTAGSYGRRVLESIPPEDRDEVEVVASEIRNTFGGR